MAAAAELDGVVTPDKQDVAGYHLVLNGLGLRTYSILRVHIYVAGLYLERRTIDPNAILGSSQPKLLRFVFIARRGRGGCPEVLAGGTGSELPRTMPFASGQYCSVFGRHSVSSQRRREHPAVHRPRCGVFHQWAISGSHSQPRLEAGHSFHFYRAEPDFRRGEGGTAWCAGLRRRGIRGGSGAKDAAQPHGFRPLRITAKFRPSGGPNMGPRWRTARRWSPRQRMAPAARRASAVHYPLSRTCRRGRPVGCIRLLAPAAGRVPARWRSEHRRPG